MDDRSKPLSEPLPSRRPYALPDRPWRLTERWRDLLFAHWPIPSQDVDDLLPPGIKADTFDQSAWVGIIPLRMDRMQLRGLPRIPGASRYPELVLRTYVREQSTNRAGVYFFCLEAANPLAVATARAVFHLPYHWARISVRAHADREFTFWSERLLSVKPVHFRARYRGLGQMRLLEQSQPGTIEHFLTERYSLFTRDHRGRLLRGDIDHQSWPLEAAEAEIERNDLPAAYGLRLPDTPPLLHYSRELVVYIWSPESAPLSQLQALDAVGARPAET